MLVEYESGSPQTLPYKPQQRQMQTEEHSPETLHICPHCKPSIQKYIKFCPLWVSQNTEKTPKHLKKILIFAPFQPVLSRFAPVVRSSGSPRESRQDRGREAQHHPTKRGTRQDQPPRWCRSAPDGAGVLPMLLANQEAHKERGTRDEGQGKPSTKGRAGRQHQQDKTTRTQQGTREQERERERAGAKE